MCLVCRPFDHPILLQRLQGENASHLHYLHTVLEMNGLIVPLCCLVLAPYKECWYDAALCPMMKA